MSHDLTQEAPEDPCAVKQFFGGLPLGTRGPPSGPDLSEGPLGGASFRVAPPESPLGVLPLGLICPRGFWEGPPSGMPVRKVP